MKKNNHIKLLSPLLGKTFFTAKEAANYGVSAALLSYYVKTHLIDQVARGIYKGIDAEPNADFRWQDMIVTVKSITGGVVCLISALAIYELTDEIPRSHWIAIDNKRHAPIRENTIIKRMRDCSTGKTTIKLGEETIDIFDRERTIIDAFRYLPREISLKSLHQGLSGSHSIGIPKLEYYAKKMRVNISQYLEAYLKVQ